MTMNARREKKEKKELQNSFEHLNDHIICFFSHNTHFIEC